MNTICLFIIIIIILIVLYYIKTQPISVDVVITWVESTEDFIKEKNEWLKKNNYKEQELNRYDDNKELMYCLRSIEKYFPDCNKVYLVVKDDQFPKYLKTNHPKLKVIKHSEIIPKEYLPTFNSFAIECYLHRIPGLHPYYLYFNDDMMLINDMKNDFFINKETKIPYNMMVNYAPKNINSITIDDEYNFVKGVKYNNLLLNKISSKNETRWNFHIPKMFNKSLDYKIEKYFNNLDSGKNSFDKTGSCKFRKNDNLFLVPFVKTYMYEYKYGGERKYITWEQIVDITLIGNEYQKLDKLLEMITWEKRQFLCINNIDNNPKNFEAYLTIVNKLFPEKSSFEI